MLSLVLGTLLAAEATPLVKPTEVVPVVADGRHNAFTAFVRYRDLYWLAFRTAKDHNSRDGDIIVLSSPDAKSWSKAMTLDVEQRDDRDPQFLIAGDRLIMYDAALKGSDGLITYATYTDDGKTWSQPRPVYEPQFFIWKPTAFQGKYYSGAHKKDESTAGKGRAVHFVVSDDGLEWKKLSTIRAGNWESETTLHFLPDGQAVAFLRQKYGSPQAQVLKSRPPYETWTAEPPTGAIHFSGHSVHTIDGVTYLFSRAFDNVNGKRESGQMIYTFAEGRLTPYCRLPAGGDCAYAEAVKRGSEMLVSYYSSHEGKTNVYLATVPLRK